MVDNVLLSLNKAFCHSVIQAGGVWWDGCARWASRGVKLWLDEGAQRLCLVPSTLYFLETIASGGGSVVLEGLARLTVADEGRQ